jgi:lipocalin
MHDDISHLYYSISISTTTLNSLTHSLTSLQFNSVHQQAVNFYTPPEQSYCVTAQYSVKSKSSFWGYTIDVYNYAQDVDGASGGGSLCASVVDDDSGSQLGVAPCWLPKLLDGPYWIVAYDPIEGYALISGGQPTIIVPEEVGCGGNDNTTSSSPGTGVCCKTGEGINNSGLWIFSRSPVRNDTLIEQVRGIATDAGFATTTVLFDVNHTDCPNVSDMGAPFTTTTTTATTATTTATITGTGTRRRRGLGGTTQ